MPEASQSAGIRSGGFWVTHIMKDQCSQPAQFLDQLNDTKDLFLILIAEAPESIWDHHFEGERWTIKEELVHIIQVVELIPNGIERASKGRSRSLLGLIPARVRSWLNGRIIIPQKAKTETRETIAQMYQNAHNILIDELEKLKEVDWKKGMPYPRKYRTIEQMAYRPVEHFNEHETHIRDLLKVNQERNTTSMSGNTVMRKPCPAVAGSYQASAMPALMGTKG